MDCKTISLYRNLELLAVKQSFKHEPTKINNESSGKLIASSTGELKTQVPKTCEVLNIKA